MALHASRPRCDAHASASCLSPAQCELGWPLLSEHRAWRVVHAPARLHRWQPHTCGIGRGRGAPAKAQRRGAERVHALEQLDAQAQLDASRLEWDAAVAGAASADKALQVARARHEVGRASLLELQDARVTWMRAMATRARGA
ncbi:TolC family protein [Gemmatimonas sp.]|uniref:TolC family protein n=1 Tax=Gemmatimonas sp. TaxID=1962908 RepID=UPI00333E1AB7